MSILGVVITDGVGFRNFIITDFIVEAKKKYDKVVIISCLPAFVYNGYNLECEVVELEVFEEKFPTWLFRKFKEVTHLQLNAKNNFGIRDNLTLTKSKSQSLRGAVNRVIYNFSAILKSEGLLQVYNKLQQFTFRKDEKTKAYKEILKQHAISSLFFTHQRPPFIAPLIYTAEKLGIKTTAFIFSWDNLGSKGRMAGNFNHYLVWSDLMKKDLMEFYPTVTQNQIQVVGTPQFEPYVMDKFGYNKNALKEKFKLSDKPFIFFTCNDSSSENDVIYLDCLAGFINNGKLAKKVDLVVRTSPAEDPVRFNWIKEKYPFIIWNEPDWTVQRKSHQEMWTQRVPSLEDINDLKSLLKFCAFNINVLSTITLDAFIFEKPVINPVFGNKDNYLFDDQKFLRYRHLEHLVRSDSSIIVKNEKEFLDALNFLLTKEEGKSLQRKKFLEEQISRPLGNTSQRVACALKEFDK